MRTHLDCRNLEGTVQNAGLKEKDGMSFLDKTCPFHTANKVKLPIIR
jgi:hypothetical protein